MSRVFLVFFLVAALPLPALSQVEDEGDFDELPDGTTDIDRADEPFFDDLEEAAAASEEEAEELPEPDMPMPGEDVPVDEPPPDDVGGSLIAPGLRELLGNDAAPRTARFFRDLSFGLPQVPLTAVAVDPGDPDVILVGADGFVFKTDDGGESWRATLSFPRGLAITLNLTPLPQDEPFNDATALPDVDYDEETPEIDDGDNDLEADIDDPDEFDTEDAEDFEAEDVDNDPTDLNSGLPSGDFDVASVGLPTPVLPGVRRMAFVSKKSRTLYVATPRGIYKSLNAGETFSEIELPGGPNSNDVRDVAIDPIRPQRVFAATRAGLFVSEDGGQTFLRAASGSQGPATRVISARVGEEDVVVVGTERGLLRSRDGGITFQQVLLQGVGPFTPVSALAYDERDEVTYAGTPLGLFASVRSAAIFERRRTLTAEPIESLSVDDKRAGGVAVGITGRGLVLSNDTGLTIVQLPEAFPASDARDIARSGVDSDRVFVATERGLFVHDEGTGVAGTLDQFRKLKAAYATDATLAEASEMALRYFGIHPAGYRDMAKRARYMAYGPRIWAAYRYTNGRGTRIAGNPDDVEAFDYDVIEDLEEDAVDLGFTTILPPQGQYHSAFVGVVWDLDKLIYRSEEASIRTLQPQITRGQRRIINRIQILYGVRRRLITEIVLDDSEGDVQTHLRRSLKLQEATAQLDGLTGGGFSIMSAERGAQDDTYMLLERPEPALSFDADPASTRGAQAAPTTTGVRLPHIPKLRLSAETSGQSGGDGAKSRNHTASQPGRAPGNAASFKEERRQ